MKCFLSHNSKDKLAAEKIGRLLLNNGIDVWFDKWEIYAGESLTTKIEEGIKECSSFVILLSEKSVKAKWVKEELKIAIQRRLSEPDFILIPILLEQCEIPSFLKDYVYINWKTNENNPEESLLRALKRVSDKPELLLEQSQGKIAYRKVKHLLVMNEYRGRITSIHENMIARALLDIHSIDKAVSFAGTIENVYSDTFIIERSKINTKYEKWALNPAKRIKKGKEFDYQLNYTLNNSFDEKDGIWFYGIEAPTDKISIIFDFTNSTPIDTMHVYHKQGQTLADEIVQPILENNMWIWEKLFPVYKDTYEFHFTWR